MPALKVNISEAVLPNSSKTVQVLIQSFARGFNRHLCLCLSDLQTFFHSIQSYTFVDSTGCLLFSFAPPSRAALLAQPSMRTRRLTLPRLSCTRTSTRSCSRVNMASRICTRSSAPMPSLPLPRPAPNCRRAALPPTTPTISPSTVSSGPLSVFRAVRLLICSPQGVPSLLYTTDNGNTYDYVPVMRFSAYYNLGETQAEIAIPQDLKMVAGSAAATTADGSPADAKVEWFCEGDDASSADENGFPSTTCSTHLQTLLYFPQCVNEDTLETAYKSRSYGTDNWCPEGSKSMPQLRFSIRYDLRKALPDGWSGTAPIKLASGNAWSSHGDL